MPKKSSKLPTLLALTFAAQPLLADSYEPYKACFEEAAKRQNLPSEVLIAVAEQQSNFDSDAVKKESNGSKNYGLMSINSRWLKILEFYGISENDLLDPCSNIHIGAWIFAKGIAEHGWSWRGIGAYFSNKDRQQLQFAKKVTHRWKELSGISTAKIYNSRNPEIDAQAQRFRQEIAWIQSTNYTHRSQAFPPPAASESTSFLPTPRLTGSQSTRKARYEKIIESAAQRHQLPIELIHAVIRAESGYDPTAVSRAGAQGLMQLMPGTAARFGVKDSFDPAQNIQGGAAYLRHLLDLFNQDVQLALAGYNAGEGAVIKHGRKIPPYKETKAYVPKVLRFMRDEEKRRQDNSSKMILASTEDRRTDRRSDM